MPVNLFIQAIDAASEMCGGQNALARELGIDSGRLSKARAGKERLNEEQIRDLAALLKADPGELWDLQELANMPRRNPFKHTLSKGLAAFFLVNLSACSIGDSPNASSTYALPSGNDVMHIVATWLSRFVDAIGLNKARAVPMHCAC